MSKKLTDKDKKDWENFLDNKDKVEDKDSRELKFKKSFKEKTIDLHGYSLEDANKKMRRTTGDSPTEWLSKVQVCISPMT